MIRLSWLSVVALGLLSCRFGFEPTATDAGPGAKSPDASAVDATPSFDADPSGMADATPTVDCWDPSWSERQRLTFDNSGQTESLTDFPVLVKLNAGNFDYQRSQDSGQDLRFVDPDGTTLAHEIELWNETGDSFVWVQVPRIDGASNADYIWIHYGNASVGDGQNASAVWDADHVGVWHMAETTGAHVDSALGLSCSWLGTGSGSQDAVGKIGGANDFDGDSDATACGQNQIDDTIGSTITAWVNLPLTGATDHQIVSLEVTTGSFQGIALSVRSSDGAVGKWMGAAYAYATQPTSRVLANEWSMVAIRGLKDSVVGLLEVSVDSGLWETISAGDTQALRISPSAPLAFGEWPGTGPSTSTNGRIDEIRISKSRRSDDWVRAQYLSSTGAFVSATVEPQQCP